MRSPIHAQHWNDINGNPAGGNTFGNGFAIGWQNGPLGQGESRKEPNGAFVEDIIQAAIDRLQYYQNSRFACISNQNALEHLHEALEYLRVRTQDREDRRVEGTHQE